MVTTSNHLSTSSRPGMTESDFKSLMTTDLFNVSGGSQLEQILKVYAPELKDVATWSVGCRVVQWPVCFF